MVKALKGITDLRVFQLNGMGFLCEGREGRGRVCGGEKSVQQSIFTISILKMNYHPILRLWHLISRNMIWSTVEISVAAHDTTGGMVTKIWEAAMIAKLGIDVYIVKVPTQNVNLLQFYLLRADSTYCWMQAATTDSLRALSGELRGNEVPEDWLGTVIRMSR